MKLLIPSPTLAFIIYGTDNDNNNLQKGGRGVDPDDVVSHLVRVRNSDHQELLLLAIVVHPKVESFHNTWRCCCCCWFCCCRFSCHGGRPLPCLRTTVTEEIVSLLLIRTAHLGKSKLPSIFSPIVIMHTKSATGFGRSYFSCPASPVDVILILKMFLPFRFWTLVINVLHTCQHCP